MDFAISGKIFRQIKIRTFIQKAFKLFKLRRYFSPIIIFSCYTESGFHNGVKSFYMWKFYYDLVHVITMGFNCSFKLWLIGPIIISIGRSKVHLSLCVFRVILLFYVAFPKNTLIVARWRCKIKSCIHLLINIK